MALALRRLARAARALSATSAPPKILVVDGYAPAGRAELARADATPAGEL